MARGFFSGVLWGGAVSVLGLGLVSVLNGPVMAPQPEAEIDEPVASAPQAPAPDAPPATTPEPPSRPVAEMPATSPGVPDAPETASVPGLETAPAPVPDTTQITLAPDAPVADRATTELPLAEAPVLPNPQSRQPQAPVSEGLSITTSPAQPSAPPLAPPEPLQVAPTTSAAPEDVPAVAEDGALAEGPDAVAADVGTERVALAEPGTEDLARDAAAGQPISTPTPTPTPRHAPAPVPEGGPVAAGAERDAQDLALVDGPAEDAMPRDTTPEEGAGGPDALDAEAPEPDTSETDAPARDVSEDAMAQRRSGSTDAAQGLDLAAAPAPTGGDGFGDKGALPDAAPAPDPDVSRAPQAPQLPQITAQTADPAATAPQPGVGTGGSDLSRLAPEIATDRLPTTTSEAQAAAAVPTRRPLEAFAAPLSTAPEQPLMSIVLIDNGALPLGLEALDSFPYPLTFAVAADRDGAAEAMARYRAAGFEVMALVNLPEAAVPSDVEVSLRAALEAVPEAVAVLEGDGSGLQASQDMSDQVAAVLAESGHGLVLYPKGLNTAVSLADRAGVPTAALFRDFDAEGQDARVIRRFLDQAAFKARQEGAVVMIGRLRAETISALLLWGLQDRASRVSLVPVSAVLSRDDGA